MGLVRPIRLTIQVDLGLGHRAVRRRTVVFGQARGTLKLAAFSNGEIPRL
jgi:hypothetical protein